MVTPRLLSGMLRKLTPSPGALLFYSPAYFPRETLNNIAKEHVSTPRDNEEEAAEVLTRAH